jgi:divalent metal cation (Fe/Co/Zn/Cd) transporter
MCRAGPVSDPERYVIDLTLKSGASRDHLNTMRYERRRGFSLPAHGTVELIAGMAALAAPVAFGFGAAGVVVSVVLGAIMMGMGLTLQGQIGAASAWHGSFDSVFVIVTALAALGLAVGGERSAAVFLAALVAVQALLSFTTRYVAAG